MANASGKKLLNKIKGPAALKKFSVDELREVASEIRSLLAKTVSENGGHLSSNLGAVELTLALHRVYNSPKDKIIFDVSHQGYIHKILTGRFKRFASIRKQRGLSGYLNRSESDHDAFGAGHAGTAVSAALGFAEAREIKKEKNQVVAIVGDGSLTCGLTYEGLNNIGQNETDITVVLNDNGWSISKNIGGIAKYLEKITLNNAPSETIFSELGFKYFGPVDGHDFDKLIEVFNLAKKTKGPKLVHVITKKGQGNTFAESNPSSFHFANPFDLETGEPATKTDRLSYSKFFGLTLAKIAKRDPKIVAITAAMPAGVGLNDFAREFPKRYYDVGIAEEHAVTFAAGLALSGLKPVVAIYSTFLQRSYDQILHDVALQKAPVIFALDRAGIGTDGPTHNGLFDLSYLRNIPNIIILAPKDEVELGNMLYSATFYSEGPIAIRYPRALSSSAILPSKLKKIKLDRAERLIRGKDAAILSVGSMVKPSVEAAELLKGKNINVAVYNARSVKPLDRSMLRDAVKTGCIITVEENVLEGGFGSAVLEEIEKLNIRNVIVKRIGAEGFVAHGETSRLRDSQGLSAEKICQKVQKALMEKK